MMDDTMSTELMTLAFGLTANDPSGLDLTDPVHLNRTHEVADPLLETDADEFVAFIETLDEPAWNRLVANTPEENTKREPAEFGGFSNVTRKQLHRAAGL